MWDVLITDVDGVLTNGRFLYDEQGKRYKEFGPHDADAVKFFKRAGVSVFAISADKRGFAITERRLKDMGVTVELVSEKERLDWVLEKFDDKRVAFVGDGYFDIPVLRKVCCGYAPANALKIVKENADKVLTANGGEGVLLEVFEHYLLQASHERYFQFIKGDFR